MSTTSKLGADMTENQIATLTRLAMILEAGQAENGIDLGRQEEYAEALRAILARQPAAIDRQEAERYRWLRDRSNDIEWPIGAGWGELGEAEGQEFDAIVDNAMRASNGT